MEDASSQAHRSDVVICGGGLAGLLMARQLRRELPDLSVTVVERTTRPLPDACHKVGESSVELASQYMERLGLGPYLLDRHLVKFGLRFFPGGGQRPLEDRTEIGPVAEPVVRSYQLDRGRLEDDLRGMLEDDGVTLIEGGKVGAVELGQGEADHRVSVTVDVGGDVGGTAGGDVSGTAGKQDQELTCRWVIDATGRNALLRKRMKLTRTGRHEASAGWFRIAGKLDINCLVPESDEPWHRRAGAENRWRSTNHLMGEGYWVWIIPLSTNHTSIGAVIHDDVHDPKNIAGLEATREFIRKHEPVLARELEKWEVKDFRCVKGYCHRISRSWSEDRWALVGEAGAFVDPLYSPGSDYICIANSFTAEMIRTDLEGRDMKAKANALNAQYRAFVEGGIDLFRRAAPVYGHASAMCAKVYWDDLVYWSFTAQFMLQDLYRLPEDQFEPFFKVANRWRELAACMQDLFRSWAIHLPEEIERTFRAIPTFPSPLVDAHEHLTVRMTPAETLDYMTMRVSQADEVAGEILLRLVQRMGPEIARKLLDDCRPATFGIKVRRERVDAETLRRRERRDALSEIARDVERTLGPIRRHADAAAARDMLLQELSTPATQPASS